MVSNDGHISHLKRIITDNKIEFNMYILKMNNNFVKFKSSFCTIGNQK